MAPVILAMKNEDIEQTIIHTGQHDDLFHDVMNTFDLKIDIHISRKGNQKNLNDFSAGLLSSLSNELIEINPDMVLVHGDTVSCYIGALASYHLKIPVTHVEAGLRTYDREAPFPEEVYRQMVDRIASIHFAPDAAAKKNLISEKIPEDQIHITGNTVVDALMTIQRKLDEIELSPKIKEVMSNNERQKVLLTLHRREIHGEKLKGILKSLREFSEQKEVQFICPVHPNPEVKKSYVEILEGLDRFTLVEPQSYPSFVKLMASCDLIVTDSGGIQEESPVLGKQVLVLRDKTERKGGLQNDYAILCGTSPEKIIEALNLAMAQNMDREPLFLYGDGQASARIVLGILNFLR